MDIEFVKVVTRFARSDLLSDDPGTQAPTLYASALRSLSQKRFFSVQPRRTLRLGGGILRKNELTAEPPSAQRRRRVFFPTDFFAGSFNGSTEIVD